MYCDYKHSVVLPYGAVGWSAVCDCGMTFSKNNIFETFFQEYHQIVNQFDSRLGLTFCQA